MEQTEGGRSERRLILGFDARCLTCSELARRIEEQTGDRLQVSSLREPKVDHLRKQALGENTPWRPTLIEIKGSKVRAWTGLKMGVVLSRRLGLAVTWRVMQVLGERGLPKVPRDPGVKTVRPGMSRGQFLKGVGGVAVTMSILSGTDNVTATTAAYTGSPAGLKSVRRKDFRGKDLTAVAREVAQRSDVVNIMGRARATKIRDGRVAEDGGRIILIQEGARSSVRSNGHMSGGTSPVEVKAARHTLANGTGMLAVGYMLPDDNKFVLYYEFDQPIPDGTGELHTRAAFHAIEGEELVLENISINGGLLSLQGANRLSSTRVTCGRCYTTYKYRSLACVRQRWGCLLVACAACIPACTTIIGCVYCAGIQCPYAYLYACCRERGYVCPPCRG